VIEAFYFGPHDEQLFATYHPPAGGNARSLTVICPPLFSEYMRTQHALRELAIVLAAEGQHVLRFDYRGTGDSSGDLEEVAISDWLEDIQLAIREGRDVSGCTMVQLLGVRAGALLACRSAGACAEIEKLVLWDPVQGGTEYIENLRHVQAEILERNRYLSRAERREAMLEYGGHHLSERMLKEFHSLDARAYSSVPKQKLHVVSTSQAAAFPVEGVSRDVAQFSCEWETPTEDQMLPQPVLERLTACLTLT